MPRRVARVYARRHHGGSVLLGVSGGADSVALLRATLAGTADGGPRPIVAHFDHALRDGSGGDAEWVRDVSARFGVECHVGRADGPRERGSQSEDSSRRRRYAFLTQIAQVCEATTVAVAHTADDQAETVLFHLLRGTGLRGLGGIPTRRPLAPGVTLLRPLLGTTRWEVETYLATVGQPFLTDPTNVQSTYSRNRLRHELLPRLRAEFNPRVDDALRRLARQAAEASRLLSRQASAHLTVCLLAGSPTQLRFHRASLATLPALMRREVLMLAWRRADWPLGRMTARHWRCLSRLALRGGRLTLPTAIDSLATAAELIVTRRTV